MRKKKETFSKTWTVLLGMAATTALPVLLVLAGIAIAFLLKWILP